jgi:hypothetical protein
MSSTIYSRKLFWDFNIAPERSNERKGWNWIVRMNIGSENADLISIIEPLSQPGIDLPPRGHPCLTRNRNRNHRRNFPFYAVIRPILRTLSFMRAKMLLFSHVIT